MESSLRHLEAPAFIRGVTFARNALVACLGTARGSYVGSPMPGATLLPLGEANDCGDLSPAGRGVIVYETRSRRRPVATIRDVATGRVLATIDPSPQYGIVWLDERTILYVPEGSGAVSALDLDTLATVTGPSLAGAPATLVPLPRRPGEFLVRSFLSVALMRATRVDGVPRVELLSERESPPDHWPHGIDGLDPAGEWYVSARQHDLRFYDTRTLERTLVRVPIPQVQLATVAPGGALIISGIDPAHGTGTRLWWFIDRRGDRAAPIDARQLPSERFEYVPSLDRLVTIVNARLDLIDMPPLGPVQTIAAAEREAYARAESERRAAEARVRAGLPERLPPDVVPIEGPLFQAAKGARAEAIGVYSGSSAGGRLPRPMPDGPVTAAPPPSVGVVTVTVKRSEQPIVLVLSAHDPTRWQIVRSAGSRLALVLTAGYHDQFVTGAEDVPVYSLGQLYAYQQGDSGYRALQLEVYRRTGLGIGTFQGRYRGSFFSVGDY